MINNYLRGIFSTQIQVKNEDNSIPARINNNPQVENKIQNLKSMNNKTDIPKSKSHTLLYSRDLLKDDKYKKVLITNKSSFDTKIKDSISRSDLKFNQSKQSFENNKNVFPAFKGFKITKPNNSIFNKKLSVNPKTEFSSKIAKQSFNGFKSFNVPRITTQMKKSKSDQLPNNVVSKYYKTMEISVKAGEKLFNNIDLYRKERYNNIKGICERSDNKIQNIIQTQKNWSLFHPHYVPKLKSLSVKKSQVSVRVAVGGSGKHMGCVYNPHDYYYPVHQMKDRNKYGQKFIY